MVEFLVENEDAVQAGQAVAVIEDRDERVLRRQPRRDRGAHHPRAPATSGIETVAVYSDADAGAPHVRLADEAVEIGRGPRQELPGRRRDRRAPRAAGADAVHPGYGFLAENAGVRRARSRTRA